MSGKSVKYTLWILYGLFLSLLAYYSVYYRRADEAAYIILLSSFFFLVTIAMTPYFEKLTVYIEYLAAAAGIVFPVAGFFITMSGASERPSGLIGDRSFEAEITAGLFLFLVTAFFLKSENKIKPALSFVAVITSGTYILALRSRTAYLAVTLCVSAMGILAIIREIRNKSGLFGRKKNKILFLCTAVIPIVILPVILPVRHPQDRDTFQKTITGVYDLNSSTNKARIDFWKASVEMFISNPVTGIGAGMWPGIYPEYSGNTYTDANIDLNSAINPHNDYLEFLSEYGIPGIFYIIFVVTGIVLLYKKSGKDSVFLPYLIAAICFSLISLFNFPKDDVVSMMFFLICLSAGYSQYGKTEDKKIQWLQIGFLSLLFLLPVLFFIIRQRSINDYRSSLYYKARNEYPEALNYMNKIPDILYPVDINKMPVEYYKGASYYELKEYDKALACFNKASLLMPHYPAIMSNRAAALYKTGNIKEAIELFKEIKIQFPNFFEPQINLLGIYANQKSDKEAKELLNELDRRITGAQFIKNYIVFLEIKNYYLKNRL